MLKTSERPFTVLENKDDLILKYIDPTSGDKQQWLNRSVLGSAMLDEDTWQKIKSLRPQDFYDPQCSIVFEAMLRTETHPDPLSTIKAMTSEELEEVGGIVAVSDYPDYATPINDYHIDRIREEAEKRRLSLAGQEIAVLSKTDISPNELRKKSEQILSETRVDDGSQDRSLQAATDAAFDMLDLIINGQAKPLVTGMPTIDQKCRFYGKMLVIIGARPSVGKTALLLQWIRSFCEDKKRGYFASVELPCEDVPLRLQSHLTGLSKKEILDVGSRKGYELAAVGEALSNAARDFDLIVDDDFRNSTIDDLIVRVEAAHRKKPLDFVGIDYAQLLKVPDSIDSDNEDKRIAHISNSCMDLTKAIGVPVFLVSQLNRNLEKRKDPIPQMSDLRGGGALEQDAEIIVFPHRQRDEKGLLEEDGEIHVPKNRNGEQFYVGYSFDGKKQWCEEMI